MNIPTKDSSLKVLLHSYRQLENTENGIVQELERAEIAVYLASQTNITLTTVI